MRPLPPTADRPPSTSGPLTSATACPGRPRRCTSSASRFFLTFSVDRVRFAACALLLFLCAARSFVAIGLSFFSPTPGFSAGFCAGRFYLLYVLCCFFSVCRVFLCSNWSIFLSPQPSALLLVRSLDRFYFYCVPYCFFLCVMRVFVSIGLRFHPLTFSNSMSPYPFFFVIFCCRLLVIDEHRKFSTGGVRPAIPAHDSTPRTPAATTALPPPTTRSATPGTALASRPSPGILPGRQGRRILRSPCAFPHTLP